MDGALGAHAPVSHGVASPPGKAHRAEHRFGCQGKDQANRLNNGLGSHRGKRIEQATISVRDASQGNAVAPN